MCEQPGLEELRKVTSAEWPYASARREGVGGDPQIWELSHVLGLIELWRVDLIDVHLVKLTLLVISFLFNHHLQ